MGGKRKDFSEQKQLCTACDTYLPKVEFWEKGRVHKTCNDCRNSCSRYAQGTEPFRDQLPGENPTTYKNAKERAIYNGKAKDDFKNPWLSYTGWKNDSDFKVDTINHLRHEFEAQFKTYKVTSRNYVE